jgi:Sec-independent protein translocase protein TatA
MAYMKWVGKTVLELRKAIQFYQAMIQKQKTSESQANKEHAEVKRKFGIPCAEKFFH